MEGEKVWRGKGKNLKREGKKFEERREISFLEVKKKIGEGREKVWR